MKICIIGFPRSRSSILLETIHLYHNIPILGEVINQLTKDYTVTPGTSISYRVLLKKYKNTTDGVIRFHPMQIGERPRHITNPKYPKFELFEFDQYDKIYFTHRESVSDIISSEFVAGQLKKYTYKFKEELINVQPMTFQHEHHQIIKDHIYSEKLVENLKQYLKSNNIDWKDLYYNDIPLYLVTNYPNAKTFYIETNYDYKRIVTNYDDILSLYNDYKNII